MPLSIKYVYDKKAQFIWHGFLSADIPSSPESFHATKSTMSSITLEWKEPVDDGGAPISAYVLEIKPSEDVKFSPLARLDGDVLSYTARKLKDNTEYQFQLRAENEAGPCHESIQLEKPVQTKAKASECLI